MKWFWYFLWSNFFFSLQAQTLAEIEKQISESSKKDTNWVLLLIKAGDMHADNRNFTKAHQYFQQALQHSQKIKYFNGIMKTYYYEGLTYRSEGNYKLSVDNHLKAIEIAQKQNNQDQLMRSYVGLGNAYRNLSLYEKSLDSYLKSLEFAKAVSNKRIEAACYNNIGEIYRFQDNDSLALEFYRKALKINRESKDERQIAINLNNIGTIYFRNENYQNAKNYFEESLSLSEKLNNKRLLIVNYINLGNIFIRQQGEDNSEGAMKYFHSAILLAEEVKDYHNLSIAKRSFSRCYMFQKDYETAEKILREALEIAEKAEIKSEKAEGYRDMVLLKIRMKSNPQEVLDWEEKYQKVLQEIQNETLTDKIAKLQNDFDFKQEKIKNELLRRENQLKEMQRLEAQMLQKQKEQENALLASQNNMLLMENEVKEAALEKERLMREDARIRAEKVRKEKELLEKDALLKKQTLEKQKYFILGASIIAVLTALLAFGLGRAYLNRKRFAQTLQLKNKEIEQQKEEILTQRDLLDEQNKLLAHQKEEILASIRYAKNIQTALLPYPKRLLSFFKDFWAFYKPRDIVSGDFYYFTERNGKGFLALADCTGHGVPGAFMSSLGIAILENTIVAKNITQAAQILQELDYILYKSLNQEGGNAQQDGMEIALCVIDKHTKTIEFAGANRPVFICVDEQNPEEFIPTKLSVGGTRDEMIRTYESQTITFEKHCRIYMFSDGYHDQFGGDKQKKLGKKGFYDILLQTAQLPFQEQEKFIREKFETWKGTNEQIDDVSIIGAWVET
ncbi:MAG: tetratricopeptide repeat protein [Raineya sp.]|nr:tetratricopeptide repeat protein [Raineya sp.]